MTVQEVFSDAVINAYQQTMLMTLDILFEEPARER